MKTSNFVFATPTTRNLQQGFLSCQFVQQRSQRQQEQQLEQQEQNIAARVILLGAF